MSDLTPAAQIDALRELTQSAGWHLYRELVLQEITGDFEEHITKALDTPDAAVALDRMRQVAAVRKAGMRWLQLPQERLRTLAESARTTEERGYGRRPVGL